MKQLYKDISYFLRQKFFILLLCITAIACYGFAITHIGIGVDDTMVDMYLEDGLTVVVGRWTCFLLNKLFHFGEYMPFITEFAGMLLLMAAVVLYCVLFKRLGGDKIKAPGYIAFACTFISCPFISEVNVYYFHNGVDLGHILCALALILFLESLDKKGKSSWICLLCSMVFLWVAAGCYETFVVAYVVGVILILFFRGIFDSEKVTFKLLIYNLFCCVCVVAGCIILRSLIHRVLIAVFSLQDVAYADAFRGIGSEFLEAMAFGSVITDISMLLKRYWLVYFVNAVVYFPIRVYVLALLVFVAVSLVCAVRKKNFWYPVLIAGTMLVPWLLSFAEMSLPLYRTCQYMPLFVASAILLLYYLLAERGPKKIGSIVFAVLSTVLVWNQSFEMNRSFYNDYKKYEYTKETMTEIAREIAVKYGSNAAVIFTGKYDQPYELIKDYVVPLSSPEYYRIRKLSDLTADPHLTEKYFTRYGYYFGGEARYSLIDWGLGAFGRPGVELVHFLQMHGYSVYTTEDEDVLQWADEYSETMPEWPAEGFMAEADGYVIVNF